MTRDPPPGDNFLQGRRLDATPVKRKWAPWMEWTAVWQIQKSGRQSWDASKLSLRIEIWQAVDEEPSVGVLGIIQDIVDVPVLH